MPTIGVYQATPGCTGLSLKQMVLLEDQDDDDCYSPSWTQTYFVAQTGLELET